MLLSPTMQLSPSQFLLSPGTVTSSLMQHTAASGSVSVSDGGGSKNIGAVAAAALEGSAPFAKLDRLVPQPTARELAAQQRQVAAAAAAAAARVASGAPTSPSPTRKPKKAGATHDKIATQLFASGSGSPGSKNAAGAAGNDAASACADAILMLSPARQKKATA